MDIRKAFEKSFERARLKKWDYIVVLVDIHDTIFKGTYSENENYEYMPYAKDVLKMMSQRNDIKMVLWSSTYPEKLQSYIKKFESDCIYFDYVNEFPEAENTNTGCFDKKIFFNVGIDNAFGFNAELDENKLNDWLFVLQALLDNEL